MRSMEDKWSVTENFIMCAATHESDGGSSTDSSKAPDVSSRRPSEERCIAKKNLGEVSRCELNTSGRAIANERHNSTTLKASFRCAVLGKHS